MSLCPDPIHRQYPQQAASPAKTVGTRQHLADTCLAIEPPPYGDSVMVRRLTPAECARLQSCPDDMAWPCGITKTAMYRIIGNGWACGLAWHLSRALADADPESRTVVDLFCGGGLCALGWHGRYWSMGQ